MTYSSEPADIGAAAAAEHAARRCPTHDGPMFPEQAS